jgi:VCBS repeat-containing protein
MVVRGDVWLGTSTIVWGTSTGGGIFSVNATTGAFTYTPTTAQRQAATGSTTDTVTITASNGVTSAAKTITVAVQPGTPDTSLMPGIV